jgi:hypothetical protein
LSKQPANDDRFDLPPGFEWADWSGQASTIEFWKGLDAKGRQQFRTRFMAVRACDGSPRKLPKEKYFIDKGSGIGKGKVKYPSPGLRSFDFRIGDVRFITHFAPKDDDHDKQIARALAAQIEHIERAKKREQAGRA